MSKADLLFSSFVGALCPCTQKLAHEQLIHDIRSTMFAVHLGQDLQEAPQQTRYLPLLFQLLHWLIHFFILHFHQQPLLQLPQLLHLLLHIHLILHILLSRFPSLPIFHNNFDMPHLFYSSDQDFDRDSQEFQGFSKFLYIF